MNFKKPKLNKTFSFDYDLMTKLMEVAIAKQTSPTRILEISLKEYLEKMEVLPQLIECNKCTSRYSSALPECPSCKSVEEEVIKHSQKKEEAVKEIKQEKKIELEKMEEFDNLMKEKKELDIKVDFAQERIKDIEKDGERYADDKKNNITEEEIQIRTINALKARRKVLSEYGDRLDEVVIKIREMSQ